MVKVKICGLCHPPDAADAAEVGADYGGVILAPGYRRTRSWEEAAAIFDAAAALRRVGVFVDPSPDAVSDAVDRLRLDVIQLHGRESPELVASIRSVASRAGAAVWKAVRLRTAPEFLDGVARYAARVDALLLDGWSAAAAGGTGARFPWAEVAHANATLPPGLGLVVAGGLNPENVAEAVRLLAPDVVDVSSGVESEPGRKDAARMGAFVRAVRSGLEEGRGVADRVVPNDGGGDHG